MASGSATEGTAFHAISISDRFVRLTRSNATPETFGGNDAPAPRFLRSTRLQQHVREVFGERVLAEVLSAAEIAATLPMTRRKA